MVTRVQGEPSMDEREITFSEGKQVVLKRLSD